MPLTPEVESALGRLKAEGHAITTYVRAGALWFDIDSTMLASVQEMAELGLGVHSLAELEGLMRKRRQEEQGRL